MKKRFFSALLFAGIICGSTYGQSVPASPKTQQAIDLGLVMPSTDIEMLSLNTKAEKLVWTEELKSAVNPDQVFQLMTHAGEEVTLSLEQLLSINPLLYVLPQQANRCENLIVATTDAGYKMLVVRSEQMMANEIKRASLKSK
jgi:hypothetical protein